MTVKELKIAISKLPDDMLVYAPSQLGEYHYRRVHSVGTEDINDEDDGWIEVCVIDERL